ncbi:MAG: hypothetical protein ACM3PU_07770 [Gemmatimonadota bacterium]
MTWRPSLAEDPDERLLRWGWLAWAIGALLLAGAWWGGGALDRASMLAWTLAVPGIALWLLWPIWRGAHAYWHWVRARPLAQWHGSYFEFRGRQVRVLFDGDDIHVIASDVFDVLELFGRARDPERVRQIAGRDGLALMPGTSLLAFTERGLAAWMERRTDPVAAEFKRWFETQVALPYRRRNALVREESATAARTSGSP